MSRPRTLFLDERKSVFRDVRMQANLSLMFERKPKISCNGGRSVTKNLRARQDCMQTSRKTDFCQKNETSARLKITFVHMTYPGQRPELPSLSRHFLLVQNSKTNDTLAGTRDSCSSRNWPPVHTETNTQS